MKHTKANNISAYQSENNRIWNNWVARDKARWNINKWIVLSVFFLCLFFFLPPLWNRLNWLHLMMFIIAIFIVIREFQRQGYKEGYFDGCKDMQKNARDI